MLPGLTFAALGDRCGTALDTVSGGSSILAPLDASTVADLGVLGGSSILAPLGASTMAGLGVLGDTDLAELGGSTPGLPPGADTKLGAELAEDCPPSTWPLCLGSKSGVIWTLGSWPP